MTIQSTVGGTGAIAGALGSIAGDPTSGAGLAAAAQPVSQLAFTGAGPAEIGVAVGLVLVTAGALMAGLARRHLKPGGLPPGTT